MRILLDPSPYGLDLAGRERSFSEGHPISVDTSTGHFVEEHGGLGVSRTNPCRSIYWGLLVHEVAVALRTSEVEPPAATRSMTSDASGVEDGLDVCRERDAVRRGIVHGRNGVPFVAARGKARTHERNEDGQE
jgi:hypothetical protein